MSKLHKFLSILLAVMMVISIVPVTASATASGDWEYNVLSEENKTAEITKYNGSATAVVTPTSPITRASSSSSKSSWSIEV